MELEMQSEFMIMKKQLEDLFEENRDLRKAVKEVNKVDMIRASMIIRNTRHDILAVDRILDGDLQRDVTVGDYVFIQNFGEVLNMAYSNLDMGNSFDKNLLLKTYRILAENPEAGFRKSNPVVYAFNHVPPHRVDIDELLTEVFRKLYSSEAGNNVVMKAMYLHNKLIDIYPFDDYNGEIAVFAMNYYLMSEGLMPISIPMDRQDYLDLVAACLKGNRQSEFYEFLYKTINDKMQRTIAACSEVI